MKFLRVLGRLFPIRRKKRVYLNRKRVRGTFGNGEIEVEAGPDEKDIVRHEAGHACFLMSGIAEKWEKRLGPELAGELEEDAVDFVLPLYMDTVKRNKL